ncbi:MAG: ATP phosphoribosyltransferase regulatory subunit [Salinarimonadaceae bacterium]|nr:MAG: ATP phosphoribosyltransferase regulatory subunit [Salinarimonadaceae bacterium]
MNDATTSGDALVALFEGEGYRLTEPPVLQPAELFLDLSGEDMRRRMFITQDAAGTELCLRPEYTIPVCRVHLSAGAALPAAYCYRGPVFRLRAGETGEFMQAGVESIGRDDAAAADAEILALALDGLSRLDVGPVSVRLGDVGLLEAVIDALSVPPALKGRLVRDVVSGRAASALAAPAQAAPEVEHAGLLAAIEGQDPQAARAFVEDVLSIAGISTVGGRSAGDIAERFLARAAQRAGALSDEARMVLRRYLAIAGDPDDAGSQIRDLARDASLDIEAALKIYEERAGFLAARGVDLSALRFRADFARNLDYYTGFIFEIVRADDAEAKPLVGGGRYDRLLTHLDRSASAPAVGCSFWLDRIAALETSGGAA